MVRYSTHEERPSANSGPASLRHHLGSSRPPRGRWAMAARYAGLDTCQVWFTVSAQEHGAALQQVLPPQLMICHGCQPHLLPRPLGRVSRQPASCRDRCFWKSAVARRRRGAQARQARASPTLFFLELVRHLEIERVRYLRAKVFAESRHSSSTILLAMTFPLIAKEFSSGSTLGFA